MKLKRLIIAAFALFSILASSAFAQNHSTISLAVGGYDLVSYHGNAPVRGNGHHLAVHKGSTYAFANAQNKDTFLADPERYLPQFGGYCAYGASLGKKFYGDPTIYEVVDGKLYLNLDAKIQQLWAKDKSQNIAEAHKLWSSIKYVPAAEL